MEITNIKITKNNLGYSICGDCLDESRIPIDYDDFENQKVYLHRDKVWRRFTINKITREYSGYFATLNEAKQQLNNYRYPYFKKFIHYLDFPYIVPIVIVGGLCLCLFLQILFDFTMGTIK